MVSWDGMGFIDYGLCFGVWGLGFIIHDLSLVLLARDGWMVCCVLYCMMLCSSLLVIELLW